jgi:hypothetical protein
MAGEEGTLLICLTEIVSGVISPLGKRDRMRGFFKMLPYNCAGSIP